MSETVADDPKLIVLWDASKNPQPADQTSVFSYASAHWRCPNGHSFQRAPRAMQKDARCPQCKAVPAHASLAKLSPALASLWLAERNGTVTFASVVSTSTTPLWWRCPEGHEFQRAPVEMLSKDACPTCALAKTSLAAVAPGVAAEWHPTKNAVTPNEIEADHVMNAWWQCPNGHEYQATVKARTQSNRRCPTCYGTWSIENIRTFVKALAGHLHALDPSELFALAMQAGVLKDKGKPFVQALTSGRFPPEELQKFANGEPSAVDELVTSPPPPVEPLTLTLVEATRQASAKPAASDPYALPAAPTGPVDDGGVTIDVSREVDATGLAGGHPSGTGDGGTADVLPVVETRDALSALDNVLMASADAETVKFLLDSAKAKLWRHAYVDPAAARAQAEGYQGDTYSTIVRDRFLAEFRDAEALAVPSGYAFRPAPGADVVLPNLMQRRVAVCVREQRRFGNWSGMGAGKTLSAILATRVVGAGLTIVCCPNAVVPGWADEIAKAFPTSEVVTKTWEPTWSDPLLGRPRYLVMNFEQFQQPNSEAKLVELVDKYTIDFIVIDEIHYAKHREATAAVSKRKRLVQGLVLEAGKKNAELCVLGMSGTPVINTLQEGKSLIEMITGYRHDDLDVTPTVQNCMRLYQRLTTLGTRWRPDYKMQLVVHKPEIDCTGDLDRIRRVGRGTVLELEQVLTEMRLPTILAHIAPGEKVLIYTHYVEGIVATLRAALNAEGLRVGVLSGETDDDDLEEFKKADGKVDVLIASSRVGTGVNGLQFACHKLIINALPWTNAEYDQLVARLWRQGSKFDKVEVIVPVTFAMVNGERWSYCDSKLQRLEYKKSIADAAVDGVVPEGNLRTPAQAQQDIMGWLARLDGGQVAEIARPVIKIPLSAEPAALARRIASYGDFSKMNARWNSTDSKKNHERLRTNPEEWGHYHTEYRRLRETWTVVPFEEEIDWLEQLDESKVVADFGCGEAIIGARVGDHHTVRSVDHIAIDPGRVDACDMTNVPQEDKSVDVAIFCLSLMGANFTDYLREAHRCLKFSGELHIWEAASRFDDPVAFCRQLERLGFEPSVPVTEGAFIRIRTQKNGKKPDPNAVLLFGGGRI